MPNKLKVAIIASTHLPKIGGMQVVNHLLAKHSRETEHFEAMIMAPTKGFSSKEYGYDYIKLNRLPYITYRWYLEQIKWNCRFKKVNLLHGSMLNMGGYLAGKASKEINKGCVVHSHGGDVQSVKEINYGAALQPDVLKRMQETIKLSDKIIAVSEINKRNIVELGADPDNVEVIHNPVLANAISKIPYLDKRPKYKIAPEEFVILSLGRNHPVKRIKLLFEAVAKLKHLNIKCMCIGPKGDYMKLAEEYGIVDMVVLTGMLPENQSLQLQLPNSELINAVRACDVFVSTSYVEAFSGAALEALACGLPTIVGQKHGVRDILSDENGYVFNDSSKRAALELSEMLEKLYLERETLKKRSNSIIESVMHLTIDSYVEKLTNVYGSLI